MAVSKKRVVRAAGTKRRVTKKGAKAGGGKSLKYDVVLLGRYAHYSEDPTFAADLIVGGQDRAGRPGQTQAAIWRSPGTGWELLPDPRGTTRSSVALRGSGDCRVVVGYANDADASVPYPVVWRMDRRGAWVAGELALPDRAIGGTARGLAPGGITGDALQPDRATWTAVYWRERSMWQPEELTSLGGRQAYGVVGRISGDVRPTILGNTRTASSPIVSRAVVWTRRSWRGIPWRGKLLPTLPPQDGADPKSLAAEMVSAGWGWVVGSSAVRGPDDFRAVLWESDGNPVDLGAGEMSEAMGVCGGTVVGVVGSPWRAFRWTRDQGVVSIHPEGWSESLAADIDGAGRIVCIGKGPYDGDWGMFLLVPKKHGPAPAKKAMRSNR